MNSAMTAYVPVIKKHFVSCEAAEALKGVQAEMHLDSFCPEWVYSLKTRRDAIETLLDSGYEPDLVHLEEGSTDYRLASLDGRYFTVTPTMFEYAVSLCGRDLKGFYLHKKGIKGEKCVDNNHEMAYY